MPKPERKEIPLDELRIDGGTQTRAAHDELTIRDYAAAYEAGVKLPDPVAFFDAEVGVYWLADGFHRRAAHKLLKRDSITVEVHPGNQRDAILYSAGCNDAHGRRRTPEDKRYCVTLLLNDEEWSANSDRWIAEKCNVSDKTVAAVRKEIADSTAGKRQHPTHKRKGRDGKTRKARNVTPKEREAGDEDQRPEGKPQKNGVPEFDWKTFNSQFGTIIKAIDLIGKPAKLHNTPEANGLRRQLAEFLTNLKTWQKSVTKQAKEKVSG